MGVRKWNALRQAHRFNYSAKVKQIHQLNKTIIRDPPKLAPYSLIREEIMKVDIGEVRDVKDFMDGTGDDFKDVKGCYRPPGQALLCLAKFYLKVDKYREDKLLQFPSIPKKDPSSFMFVVGFGGDGAPCIKGTTFLVSFLNVGGRIANSSETYLLFGADCGEESVICERFVAQAIKEISELESQSGIPIEVDGETVKVEFALRLVPNDMKMLAFLAGELSNSATYCTTFADLKLDERNHFKTFNKWNEWKYDKRIKDADAVEKNKFCTQTRRK